MVEMIIVCKDCGHTFPLVDIPKKEVEMVKMEVMTGEWCPDCGEPNIYAEEIMK